MSEFYYSDIILNNYSSCQFNFSAMQGKHSHLDEYELLSVIGKGSFAKVTLVREKETGSLFALKSMKKKYIEKQNQVKRIMTERDILVKINHPFLIKIHSSFQDEKKLYLTLEYCPGGELFGLLAKKKKLTETATRFYAAQMILALQYLHSKDIIYRDLKPENVLIGADGYIKLTDFGLSRNNIEGDFQAFSVCGTPEYLAPEVINKVGHGKAVDWWCLGSIIYELINGVPPFYTKNRADLFNNIKYNQPFMNKQWSKNVRDLLGKLLQKSPEIRMKNVQTIKEHPWFGLINWEDLAAKKIKPHYVPVLKEQNDVSNFAPEFTKCSVHSNTDLQDCADYEGFSFQRSKTPTSPALLEQLGQEDTGEFELLTEETA